VGQSDMPLSLENIGLARLARLAFLFLLVGVSYTVSDRCVAPGRHSWQALSDKTPDANPPRTDAQDCMYARACQAPQGLAYCGLCLVRDAVEQFTGLLGIEMSLAPLPRPPRQNEGTTKPLVWDLCGLTGKSVDCSGRCGQWIVRRMGSCKIWRASC
jgi:hypothetical protein